jgi:hypothetical protein
MIDNITVRCFVEEIVEYFTPEYFKNKCGIARCSGNNDYTFELYNPDRSKSSYLTVICPHINSAERPVLFTIKGSLRKWWYGSKSTKDFCKQDFDVAINLLFDILEIPQKQRKYFYIARIEVGLNVRVKLSCSEIARRIVGYKRKSYERKPYSTGIMYNSKTVKGAKLYDKVEEISRGFKGKLIKDDEEVLFLKDYADKNIFRIEFPIAQNAVINRELGFGNIEDSITYFDNLYIYFWGQIQYLQYSDAYDRMPCLDCENKSNKEFNDYLKCIGIWYLGIERVVEMTKKLKDRNTTRIVKNFFEKNLYENPTVKNDSYDKNAFMKDIKIQILHSMKDSRNLYLIKKRFLNEK